MNQLKASEQVLINLKDQGLDDIYSYIATTGHSLGGNVAIDFTVKSALHGLRIDQCVALDSPGFSTEYLKKYKLQINQVSSKITKHAWSPVGWLLFDFDGINKKHAKCKEDNSYCVGRGNDVYDSSNPFGDVIKSRLDPFLWALYAHDTRSLQFDENGQIVEGFQLNDLLDFVLSNPTKFIDFFDWSTI
jgi:hypothetical protein